jgi:hypothetical protein
MKILSIVSLAILIFTSVLIAAPYEVLVVDIAKTGNREKIEEFKTAAAKFNVSQHALGACRRDSEIIDCSIKMHSTGASILTLAVI